MSASRASAPAVLPDEMDFLGEEPGVLRFYGWRNVDLAIWDATPSLASAAQLGRLCSARARTSTEPVSAVVVITPDAGPIQRDVWDALRRAATCRRAKFAGLYFVLEHEGFVASAIRGMLTGYLLLAKNPPPLRVVRTVLQAATLIGDRHERDTGVPVDAGELLRVLENARHRKRVSEVTPTMR